MVPSWGGGGGLHASAPLFVSSALPVARGRGSFQPLLWLSITCQALCGVLFQAFISFVTCEMVVSSISQMRKPRQGS